MDYNSPYNYPPPRRRTAFQHSSGAGSSTAPRHDSIAPGPSGAYGASPLAGRLQTPSLTSLTSATTTASMFTTTSAAESAYAGTTIRGYAGGTPPLIELDDDEMDAFRGGNAPLALESGAGTTPTDKLRMLLQQMHGDTRKPDPPTETLAPPPAYRIPTDLADPPASPPRVENTDDEYSPPTPPPRISNPYLYSRRAMERRDAEEQALDASPPRRLPSRAIALRAAAQARASNPEPESPPPRREPSALESFLASHPEPFPEPSSSRVRAESTPTRSRKGKERASFEEPVSRSRYDLYDGEHDEQEEDLPSPPRRRRLAPRRDSIEAPPDSSTQFADGLRSSAADEYDLDEDNSVPWQEDDTLDSVDSGTGRRQRLLAAEERSHSRARDYIATTSLTSRSRSHNHSPSISFGTAPSTRLHAHGTTLEADVSLPPIPEPEPDSFEDEDRSLRRRAELLRPFSREPSAPLKRSSESLRRSEATEPEPEEPTRYDTARDSARFEALRSGMSATPSFKDARSSVSRTFREVDDGRSRDVHSSTFRRKESLREIANGSSRDQEEEMPVDREQEREKQDHRERRERVSISNARESVTREYSRSSMEGSRESLRVSSSPRDRRQTSKSPSPAPPLDESNIIPAVSSERRVASPSASRGQLDDSSRSLSRSNVRWSPQVEKRVFHRDPVPEELEEEATENSEMDDPSLDEMEESAGLEDDSWAPETQFDRTPSPAPPPVRRSPEQERRPVQHTPPQDERRTARVADVARSQTAAGLSHSRADDTSRRERQRPSTPSPAQASTSPQSSPPAQRTPAGRTRSRPTPAAEPSTPVPSFPSTPAHLKGVKTPHPPGAWGTPLPPRPAAPGSVAFSPLAPLEEAVPVTPKPKPAPDYASMATPKPPGAWRSPAPSSTPDTSEEAVSGLPATPSPQGNVTLSGLPTPRPPGAWQNTPQHLRPAHQRSIPARFSSLRNEVLPDSSVSSAGSSDVSFHRIRSPKRSPQKDASVSAPVEPAASPKADLLSPVLRSPRRSPVWSPSNRAVPSTPTKSSAALVDDSFDLDKSWAGRIHRLVLSPLRPPRPSTALNDAQAELVTASRVSDEARDRVAAAQQAWIDALAAVPSDTSPPFVAVARTGWTWSVFLFWASLELLLLWVVFRVTLEYATSASLLSRLDPWHPQLASYALNVPVPAGLQAFATQRATPANLFDLLDMLGFGGAGHGQVLRAPT